MNTATERSIAFDRKGDRMPFKKTRGIEIVKILLWLAMFTLFIAYVVLRQVWMTFAMDGIIVLYGVIVVMDPVEKRGDKMIVGLIALTRIVDIVIRTRNGIV